MNVTKIDHFCFASLRESYASDFFICWYPDNNKKNSSSIILEKAFFEFKTSTLCSWKSRLVRTNREKALSKYFNSTLEIFQNGLRLISKCVQLEELQKRHSVTLYHRLKLQFSRYLLFSFQNSNIEENVRSSFDK